MPTEVTIPPDNQLYVPVFKPGDRFYKKNLHDLFKNLISEDDLGNVILPVYDTTISYAVGDYCIHDKKLYQCTTATTGTWNSNDWTDEDGSGNKLNILNVIFDGISAANLLSVSKYEGDLKSLISLFYSKSNSYAVGNIVIKEVTENNKQIFKLYYCKTAVAANEDWNANKWESFKLGQIFSPTGPGLVPPTGGDLNKVLFSNGAWATLINYVAMSDLSYLIADEYDETATYHVGDYVTYNDGEHKHLYICKVDTSDPAGTMDSTKWDSVNLTNIFSGTIPGLVPRSSNNSDDVLHADGSWGPVVSGTDRLLSDAAAPTYENRSYELKEIMTYKGHIYKCIVDSTTASEVPDLDNDWEEIRILPSKDYDAETVMEVVDEVNKMSDDLDSKINTTFDIANISEFVSGTNFFTGDYSSMGANSAILVLQSFLVPINTDIRNTGNKPTLITIFVDSAYNGKIDIALYEYNYETGDTIFIGDTGPVRVLAGKNDYILKNISPNVTELKSDKLYYAAIYLPKQFDQALKLACAPAQNLLTNGVIEPAFNMATKIAYNMNMNDSDDTLMIDPTNPPQEATDKDIRKGGFGPWGDAYHTVYNVYRYFMQIRNGTYVEPIIPPDPPTPDDPFNELSSYTLETNITLNNYANGSITFNGQHAAAWQAIVPLKNVTLKSWTVKGPQSQNSDYQSFQTYLFEEQIIEQGGQQILQLVNITQNKAHPINNNNLADNNQADEYGFYNYTSVINSGETITLEANKTYYFPVSGNHSDANDKVPKYASANPGTPSRTNILFCKAVWNINDSNNVARYANQNGCYLKIVDINDNEYIV